MPIALREIPQSGGQKEVYAKYHFEIRAEHQNQDLCLVERSNGKRVVLSVLKYRRIQKSFEYTEKGLAKAEALFSKLATEMDSIAETPDAN